MPPVFLSLTANGAAHRPEQVDILTRALARLQQYLGKIYEQAMPPKVSVIMPVYNREAFIAEAIASVLAQTFTAFELIIVDDGSTDATRAIIERVHDPRVRVLGQAHAGISTAMNTGVHAAQGEYVARLDSDDVWHPEMLATQVAELDQRGDIGAVYARTQRMEADGRLTPSIWGTAPPDPDDHLCSMLRGDFTSNVTVVVRRSCLERVGGYDPSLQSSEDWDLWLRMAQHYRFGFTDRVLAYSRSHDDNLTSRRSPLRHQHRAIRRRVLDKFYSQPDVPQAARAMRGTAYVNLHTGEGLLWFGEHEYRAAFRSFAAAITHAPSGPTALARILWLLLTWNVLNHYAWGRRLVEWQAGVRGRIRSSRAGPRSQPAPARRP